MTSSGVQCIHTDSLETWTSIFFHKGGQISDFSLGPSCVSFINEPSTSDETWEVETVKSSKEVIMIGSHPLCLSFVCFYVILLALKITPPSTPPKKN